MWDQISDLHACHREVPVEIQLLKLTEETGEAAEAFIGMHGLNSRKGVCRSRDDLLAARPSCTAQGRGLICDDSLLPPPALEWSWLVPPLAQEALLSRAAGALTPRQRLRSARSGPR